MSFSQIYAFLFELATTWGIKLLGAIIILLVGIKCTTWFTKWLRNSPKLNKWDDSFRSFLVSFTKIVLYVVLVVTVAMILGVPATSFITVLASCGVAIGLALQGSLSNFAGGLMILFFKPFKVGDYIEASGETGTVVEISVVYTELLTLDNKRITLPNGSLTNSVIKNYSSEELRRVDLTFNAAY
ncbi:MAG: mechanosensitive ion channel, partial [Clostridia bacterium]|nr:mechanosensitive ion channel [Clostridia bacterium]